MSQKPAKLILLTGLTAEESADVESQHLIHDGSMMLLFKDERRTMGYSTDGEFAFVGLDVRRQKGSPIDITKLPNVEHQIEQLEGLSDSKLHATELAVESEGGATFIFTKGNPTSPSDFVGYSNTTMPYAAVEQVIQSINSKMDEMSHTQADEHGLDIDPIPTMQR